MKGPSNPSAYSAELQTFIITKFEPLISIIQELSNKLESLEREKFYLEKRLERLEAGQVELTQSQQVDDKNPNAPPDRFVAIRTQASLQPWLFSAKSNTAVTSIQLLLEYSTTNTVILDCRDFRRENDLWLQIFDRLPSNIITERPIGSRLFELRNAARKCLLDLCKAEVLFIIKNIPDKHELDQMKTQVTLTAVLVASVSEAWERMQDIARVEMGRVAIVLLGESVGQKLRAGSQVFNISQLN